MSFRNLRLKTKYKSYADDIAADFLSPVLAQARSYDRMVGFFSSNTLDFFRETLESFVAGGGQIRLVIGEPLDEDEYDAVKEGAKHLLAERVASTVSAEMSADAELPPGMTPLRLLSWLVANRRLEIKFAAVTSSRAPGAMMHDKTGILRDINGDTVVFQGTANETVFGLMPGYNYEKISVYWSWANSEAFSDYAEDEIRDFNETWASVNDSLTVIPLPSACYETMVLTAEKLNANNPFEEPESLKYQSIYPELPTYLNGDRYTLYPHQLQSLRDWKDADYKGIFALCTGSGKTVTALHAASVLSQEHYNVDRPFCLIVSVPYQVLAEQWVKTMALFNIFPIRCWGGEKNWYPALSRRINNFVLNPDNPAFLSIVVVDKTLRENQTFRKETAKLDAEEILFIGDECHHHASQGFVEAIPKARYRIGLSATPWSVAEQDKREILIGIYSNVVAYFGMEEALELDVLCPYTYSFEVTRLDEEEWDHYFELSRKIAAAMNEQEDQSVRRNIDIWRGERARIVGSCRAKYDQFARLAEQKLAPLSLVYVGDGSVESDWSGEGQQTLRDINRASKIVSDLGLVGCQFTSRETPRQRQIILENFQEGTADVVVAIRVLDEGFDLPQVREAYLLSSSRNERQFIQRRGRILRKAKGKQKATVHDFLTLPPVNEKSESAVNLVKQELIRAFEFSKYSMNSVGASILTIGQEYRLEGAELELGTMRKEDYFW